jgi:hypothetical protein
MPPERPLSRFFRRERLQILRRWIHRNMPKRTTLLVTLILVGGVLAVASGSALSQSGTPPTPETAANNSTVAPGAQIASGVSVEGVVLESGLHRRTLDIKLTRATSAEERATIITTTMRTLDRRLDALETRYRQLRDARRAGTISDAKYHVEMTTIIAEARMIERTIDVLQTAATKLPASQLKAQYPTATTIERLGERARALATGEAITAPTETPTETPSIPTSTATPTPTLTETPTAISTSPPTATPTPTSTITPTQTPTKTPTTTPTPEPTDTPESSDTPEPTDTPEGSNTPEPTDTPESDNSDSTDGDDNDDENADTGDDDTEDGG